MNGRIKINVFGDFCLVSVDPDNYKIGDDVRAIMSCAINVANLECPITDAETKAPFPYLVFKTQFWRNGNYFLYKG